MVNIEETDFRTLDEFPIKWRWTDSRWIELPEAALKNIQPFTDKKARGILQYSLEFGDHRGLSEPHFEKFPELMRLVIHLKSNNGY
jgi:hypothetical protein